MTATEMYWITRLDYIHNFLCALTILIGLTVFVSTITTAFSWSIKKDTEHYNSDNYKCPNWVAADKTFRYARNIMCVALALFIPFLFACMLIPTTQDMVVIKTVPLVAGADTAEKVKSISSDALDAVSKWLQKQKQDSEK